MDIRKKYITLDVPEYDKIFYFQWDDCYSIKCSVNPFDHSVEIKANTPGLISLARHLLELAQENVPSGMHIHLDAFNSLEDDSNELIISKIE